MELSVLGAPHSNWYGHTGAGEFLCMDGSPEGRRDSLANEDGAVFYYTSAVCGSLPCPPYVNGKVFTCVVCSR